MSNKAECPGCHSYTSQIWDAMHGNDSDDVCRTCGLPGRVIAEVHAAQERGANAELTEKYEKAIVRLGQAEAELGRLRERMATIQRAVRGWEQEQR